MTCKYRQQQGQQQQQEHHHHHHPSSLAAAAAAAAAAAPVIGSKSNSKVRSKNAICSTTLIQEVQAGTGGICSTGGDNP
jgi:hypothetical protein